MPSNRHVPFSLHSLLFYLFSGIVLICCVAGSAASQTTDALSFSPYSLSTTDSAGPSNVFEGSTVAISGDTAIVGTYLDDSGRGKNTGAAYIFRRGETGWNLESKLSAPDGQPFDYFGWSVAISGDTAVIGAPFGASGGEPYSGVAYVFTRSGTAWAFTSRLFNDEALFSDYFGWSVAISGDTAVVGAPSDGSGAGHIFIRRDGKWERDSRLSISNSPTSEVGWSVAVQSEGTAGGAPTTVLLGAPTSGTGASRYSGAVLVFTKSNSGWSHRATLVPNEQKSHDYFGISVALDNNSAIIGASGADTTAGADVGAAFIYSGANSSWAQQAKFSGDAAGARFGWSVAINGDTAVVGAPGGASAPGGESRVFRRNGSWEPVARLVPSGADQPGWSVAANANAVVVGARTGGAGGKAQTTIYSTADINTSYIVTNTSDSGPGSLRAALSFASTYPGTRIIFNIPTSDAGYANGYFIIRPLSALPALTAKNTVLDGTSQTLFTGNSNPRAPEVLIDGIAAGQVDGLVLTGSRCTVKSVAVARFARNGLLLRGPNGGHYIFGCFLGLSADGKGAASNGGAGVHLDAGTANNTIGGTGALGNTIAFNRGAGISVSDSDTARNTMRGNSIFANAGLGIDLKGGIENEYGVTANDEGDADAGPNSLQNFPLITQASASTNRINIAGTVVGAPNSRLIVDLYRTPGTTTPDPSGYGEGQFHVTGVIVTADAAGQSNFTVAASLPTAAQRFSVTVTDAKGNTSEFSRAVVPQDDVVPPQLTVNTPLYNGEYKSTPLVAGHAADDKSGVAIVTCRLYRNAWKGHGAGFWDWQQSTWVSTSGNHTEGAAHTPGYWGNWSRTLPELELGRYVLRVRASDYAGNLTEQGIVFFIGSPDTTPPSLWIDLPTSDSEHTGLPAAIGRAADDGSGIARVVGFLYRYPSTNQTAAYWDWNAKVWSSSFGTANEKEASTSDGWANWSMQLPALAAGRYAIGMTAFDNAGLSQNATVDHVGGPDVTKPLLFLDEPLQNGRYSSFSLARGRASDGGSGVTRVICRLYRFATTSYPAGYWDWNTNVWNNNSSVFKLATTTDNWANWSVPLPPLTSGGEYRVFVYGYDKANNVETRRADFRIVDSVSLSAASQGRLLPNPSLDDAITSDASAVKLSLASLDLNPLRITLTYTDGLKAETASDPGRFLVTFRSPDGIMQTVQLRRADYIAAKNAVVLTLSDGLWHPASEMHVSWHGLTDKHERRVRDGGVRLSAPKQR